MAPTSDRNFPAGSGPAEAAQSATQNQPLCRHCATPLTNTFVDLGSAPPSNAYLAPEDLQKPEIWLPLRVLYCDHCWLVQTQDFAAADSLFTSDYAYFSSMSASWLDHAAHYAEQMTARFGLGKDSMVVEVASNDGYLLRNFQAAGIPCLGIEPTAAVADQARKLGIETREVFFGVKTAQKLAAEGISAKLMAANNVLAHVPDINDFVGGFKILLAADGVATFEFPHLLNLVRLNQFDTIYHEHFSYLSLLSVARIMQHQGLEVFDVEKLTTHGGSLRVFVQHAGGPQQASDAVQALLDEETGAGMDSPAFYEGFQGTVEGMKDALLSFLIDAKAAGKTVAAYGAAAKGNTFLNFAGVRPDLVRFVVDRSPGKQGRYMPGSRIPIVSEAHLLDHLPDYLLILPWNISDEIHEQLASLRDQGIKFVTAVPELKVR
ncbi:MAG TPA: methyltransferase domain-containing protein [Rhodobacteraceae bacterium]|nr:methyltransferase domain-containing protein [Paracoccaceae bacterium]